MGIGPNAAIRDGPGWVIVVAQVYFYVLFHWRYQRSKFSRILHQKESEVHRSRLDQPLGNAPGRAPTSQTQAEETQLFSCLNYKGVFTLTPNQICPPSPFPQVQSVKKHQHLCPCPTRINHPSTCPNLVIWSTPIRCSYI